MWVRLQADQLMWGSTDVGSTFRWTIFEETNP